jgi:hypothetical protein
MSFEDSVETSSFGPPVRDSAELIDADVVARFARCLASRYTGQPCELRFPCYVRGSHVAELLEMFDEDALAAPSHPLCEVSFSMTSPGNFSLAKLYINGATRHQQYFGAASCEANLTACFESFAILYVTF